MNAGSRFTASFWHRTQIGHRSEYSVERVLALRDYYERTSITRAVAVCLLTPVPVFLLSVLIDCIPLRDPSQGWRANYTFWIRVFFDLFAISMGTAIQVRAVIIASAISATKAITISLGSASSYLLMSIGIAAVWRFPIPFGLIFPILIIFFIGPRAVATSPLLHSQLKAIAFISFTQGIVAVLYPLFTAIFNRLSGIQQTAFVFTMPLIKFTAKAIIAKAAEGFHCYMGMMVVFSVDLFNVLYIAICMQSSTSVITTVVMVGLDCFHVIIGIRAIFHQINIARKRGRSSKSITEQPVECFEELSTMLSKLLVEPKTPKTSQLSHSSVCAISPSAIRRQVCDAKQVRSQRHADR
ncbi:hypothetical protein PHYSODRAFT_535704 [Phytophthora sojae]|uniref:Uncharacterized protein n=1 Tax=Phytophthora sojae (strain P6497) TaxID=1094619 RepID=G5AI72_PHYSP|nr:hypothetical protein PHYSODRAFT_500096 [Phytophthora sojae]XP_009539773.1 hypothetical protein PHYSODRAFT_535704 [Phytophthora sojae]EGZ04797.1 hypothetical protein PHYSODRAFT_535704 [Phytophthora sojae]EGZ18153.1 hypothetical protein PHYSODRAFT_500096 [Phytophthora sojae]|eukprot:XP_009527211.1 hypothetical protein PHYSODRAFT_500096 [Phytophthora sojae]